MEIYDKNCSDKTKKGGNLYLFNKFFIKQTYHMEEILLMIFEFEGTLKSVSQPSVLLRELKRAGISGGDQIIVNIGPVRVGWELHNNPENTDPAHKATNIYLCNIQTLHNIRFTKRGSNHALPKKVSMKKFIFTTRGEFLMKNVFISSSGGLLTLHNMNYTSITPWEKPGMTISQHKKESSLVLV